MKVTRNSRKHERVPARGLLKYAMGPNFDRFQVYNIYEISESGLSFLTPGKLESGTKLKVSVLLHPRETPIDLSAIVIRCLQKIKKPLTYQAGLRFLDMSEGDQTVLQDSLLRFLKNKKGSRPFHFVVRLHK